MAIIKCPECQKEISSYAPACPYCGYPMHLMHSAAPVEPVQTAQKKTTKKRYGLLVLAIVAVMVIALVAEGIVTHIAHTNAAKAQAEWAAKEDLYAEAQRSMNLGEYEEALEKFRELGDYEDAQDCWQYCEAVIYCQAGQYKQAFTVLQQIPEYEKTQQLLVNIYYETRFFEGISDLSMKLKNPLSLTVKSTQFHYTGSDLSAPSIVITYSAQNGFGGYSSSYALILRDAEEGSYQHYGSCDSLTDTDYDSSDVDDLLEALTANIIKIHLENPELENVMDQERVAALIESNSYTGITAVPELTYDMIKDTVFAQEGLEEPVDPM